MIDPNHGLIVFIDAQPSEQEQPEELKNSLGVICGVTFKNMTMSFPNLKDYKTPRRGKRISTAQEVTRQLLMQGVMTIGCFAKFSEIEEYGEYFLNRVPKELATSDHERLYFKDKSINRKMAKVLLWYAHCLLEIIRCSVSYAREKNQSKLFLALDNLPGNSSTSLSFLNLITNDPFFKEPLVELGKNNGVNISFGNIDSHQGLIYADWVVHSLHASVNNPEVLDKLANRTEEYRQGIASMWEELENLGRAQRVHFVLQKRGD